MPIRSSFKTSRQISTRVCSATVRGAAKSDSANSTLLEIELGSGKARRSTLPVTVRGNDSSQIKQAGIM